MAITPSILFTICLYGDPANTHGHGDACNDCSWSFTFSKLRKPVQCHGRHGSANGAQLLLTPPGRLSAALAEARSEFWGHGVFTLNTRPYITPIAPVANLRAAVCKNGFDVARCGLGILGAGRGIRGRFRDRIGFLVWDVFSFCPRFLREPLLHF